jgi:hypothetical protein
VSVISRENFGNFKIALPNWESYSRVLDETTATQKFAN